MPHQEHHHSHRSGWLRAAVLGANDGIVSTASLLLGIAAAHTARDYVLLSGVAGLAAGTMAMAAGEYVSVRSQADTEEADLNIERRGLSEDLEEEHEELAAIYVERGLTPDLAGEVARQLMAHDALAAHARDELGISESLRARPVQAAISSGVSFATGAAVPLFAFLIAPEASEIPVIAGAALLCLLLLGALAAWTGGARIVIGALRVFVWGASAMAVTAMVGKLVTAIY
jgi:VIT1/CCC1 family predicted Fe2+/Mn2+ transporter